jgi:aryl-alcohol dehydrogenase-like predicted oxidoreductase
MSVEGASAADVPTSELGGAGVTVTRLILGCGNFGGVGSSPAFFGQGTRKDEAFRLMDAAWDAGITTFDTADAYGGGRSETFIGEWLATKDGSVRDRLVVATKTYNPMEDGADHGLAPARIRRQLASSLGRLGLERVPLYLAHEFDPDVPQAESLGTFGDLVREGLIGAVGASNFGAAQLADALDVSERDGLIRYEWVQNSCSLLEQEDLGGVVPLCARRGLGVTPFSPLAGGWLTGKYRRGEPPPPGSRMTQRPEPYERYRRDPRVFDALEALEREAGDRGVSMAALALAWLLDVPGITAIVVGPGREAHLAPALEALGIELDPSERDRLTALFAPCAS